MTDSYAIGPSRTISYTIYIGQADFCRIGFFPSFPGSRLGTEALRGSAARFRLKPCHPGPVQKRARREVAPPQCRRISAAEPRRPAFPGRARERGQKSKTVACLTARL